MLKMKQEDLAAAVGVTRSTIAQFELEESQPRTTTLGRIRDVLEKAGVSFIESDAGAGVLLTITA